jgi:hypothetical protein
MERLEVTVAAPQHVEDSRLARARKVAHGWDSIIADLQRVAGERFAGRPPQDFQDVLAQAKRQRANAWKVVAAIEAGQAPDPAWIGAWY